MSKSITAVQIREILESRCAEFRGTLIFNYKAIATTLNQFFADDPADYYPPIPDVVEDESPSNEILDMCRESLED